MKINYSALFSYILLLIHTSYSQEWKNYQFNGSGLPIQPYFRISNYPEGSFWCGPGNKNYDVKYIDGKFYWFMIIPGRADSLEFRAAFEESDSVYYYQSQVEQYAIYKCKYSVDSPSMLYEKIESPIVGGSLPGVVGSIYQSHKGILWAVPYDDGIFMKTDANWAHFDSTNSTLKMNYAKELFFDSAGNTFCTWGTVDGSKGGLSVYADSQWILFDSSNSILPHNNINAVYPTDDGKVWIGTDLGLVYYENKELHSIDTLRLNQLMIGRIQKDFANRVWVEMYNKDTLNFAWFEDDTWHLVPFDHERRTMGIRHISFLPDGRILGHTFNNGFYLGDGSNWTKYTVDSTNGVFTCNDSAFNMANYVVGKDGKIYFEFTWPYAKRGIGIFDPTTNVWTEYTPYNTHISSDTVYSLAIDNSNTAWIATAYGISRFDGKNWFAWDSSIVGMKRMTSLFADSKGVLWGGNNSYSSANGLVQFDGKMWNKFTKENSELPSPEIYDLAEDTSGTLWISHREGVSTFDGTNWNHWNTGTTFPSMAGMGGLARDSSGSMWVATGKGAYRYNGSAWTAIDSASGKIPTNYLFDVAVDTAGTLWFGTLKNGVIQFDGTKSVSHTPSQDKDIRTVTADYHGNIWAITDSGAAKWNGSSWAIIDSANSDLQDNRLSAIAIGRDGSKWFGTKFNGIAHLTDDESVHTVADPAKATVQKNLSIRQVGRSLAITGANGSGSVALVDLRGRVVWQEQLVAGAGSVTISPIVAKGVYVARVSSGNQKIAQKLFW